MLNTSHVLIVRTLILNGMLQRFYSNHKLQNPPKEMCPRQLSGILIKPSSGSLPSVVKLDDLYRVDLLNSWDTFSNIKRFVFKGDLESAIQSPFLDEP